MEQKLTSLFVVPAFAFFDWGFQFRTYKDSAKAVDDEYVKFFKLLDGGSQSAEITLKIGNKKYPAHIRLSKHRAGKTEHSGSWRAMHRIRFTWDTKHETKKALRNLFLYAYVTTIDKSDPHLKELAEFVHMGGSEFKVKVVGKQVTEFDDMFRFMEDKNLFEFWRDRNDENEKSDRVPPGVVDEFFLIVKAKFIIKSKTRDRRWQWTRKRARDKGIAVRV